MISPLPNQPLHIGKQLYRFISIQNHPDITYCEVGRRAKVFRLERSDRKHFALKVFFPAFQVPSILEISNLLDQYKYLPGMEAANRLVLTRENNAEVISQYPDLEFSVLLPWIDKESWSSIFMHEKYIPFSKALLAARNLSTNLLEFELINIAHTDLSGSNVLVNIENGSVSLVGLESMYSQIFPHPTYIPAGTPGYAHPNSLQVGQWSSMGDRFSATILLAEIITIPNETIKKAAFGETFFSQGEIGSNSNRFGLMSRELKTIHPGLSELFTKAWVSSNLSECPTLGTWHDILAQVY